MAILTLPSGCYNVLTLPPQVTDLVVTTAPATINVQFTPPPAEYSEGVEYWVVYKEGGIPQHPYDGNFQKLDGGGGKYTLIVYLPLAWKTMWNMACASLCGAGTDTKRRCSGRPHL